MKRFVVAAAVAVAIGFVSAGKADAQIIFSPTYSPTGGITVTRGVVNPSFSYMNTSNFTLGGGFSSRSMGTNMYGGGYNRGYMSNPYTRQLMNYGSFYQPQVFSPFGGANFGMYSFGRR